MSATPPAEPGDPDPHVQRLARLFAGHPAWLEAARRIRDGSSSAVYFTHLPGEPWQLVREQGENRLQPGRAADPDFAFCFPPAAVEALEAVEGGYPAFALELFRLILDPDPERHIGFRIVAPLRRLMRRGYVRLVLDALGPELLAFGAVHGVRSLPELYRLVVRLRKGSPEPWERED